MSVEQRPLQNGDVMITRDLPRVRLGHLNTPLQHLPRLSEELRGPQIYLKRDDCIGLGVAGSSARKLEFLLGDALLAGADTVVTQSSARSPHACQTAAAAARIGLDCTVVVDVAGTPRPWLAADLCAALGSNVLLCSPGESSSNLVSAERERLTNLGREPYVIPESGTNAIGCAGFVHCAGEIVEQVGALGISGSCIVVPVCTGGSCAGILAGMRLSGEDLPVLGIPTRSADFTDGSRILELVRATSEVLAGEACKSISSRFDIDQSHCHFPVSWVNDALAQVMELEGVLLDHGSSGNAMAALIELIREGEFARDSTIILLHSGDEVHYPWTSLPAITECNRN